MSNQESDATIAVFLDLENIALGARDGLTGLRLDHGHLLLLRRGVLLSFDALIDAIADGFRQSRRADEIDVVDNDAFR